jgi:hypothetical protein
MQQLPPLPPGFQLRQGAPSAPINSGVPTSQLPSPQTPVQQQRDMTGLTLDQIKIEEAAREREAEERKRRGAMEGYQRAGQTVLRSTTRALEYLDKMQQGGGFIPAASRAVQSKIIGTDEYQFTRQIEDLKRNIGLDRLQQMRDNSPTGGALGQVPVQQQAMLEDTLGSFDISQPGDTLRENLNQLNNIYLDIMFGSPAERAEAVAAGRMTAQEAEQIEQYYRETEFDLFGRRKAEGEGNNAAKSNEVLGKLLQRGASRDEILELARELNLTVDEDALDANIRSRDEGGPINAFVSKPDGPDGGGGGILPTGEEFMSGLAQGAGDVVQGVGDTIGMITDPFARTLADALGFDGSAMPSLGTSLREGVGLPQSPEGIGRDVRELASGAFVGGAATRGLGALASPGTTQNVLATLGRTPIRDTVAGAGAGAGANIGEQIGGTPGQVVGMLAGGLGGYGAANATMRATSQRAPNALAQAAGRQGVDLLPADAGGPVARAVTTGTRASPLSVAPVASAAEQQQQQFGNAVRRTAANQGEVVDTQQAGNTIKQGAQDYIQKSRERGNRLYERAAQQSRGVKIKPQQTVAAGREALARLKENPAASPSEVKGLESFVSSIEGGVSIQGLRDARTKLSEGVYGGQLRSSSDQAMWKGILGNVADDIDAGLRSVGRDDAADTFRVADKLWSERIETIERTLAPIIGKDGLKSGEEVLSAIESMTRGKGGGNLRLSRLLGTLSKEEAGNVRATLVDRLGRATPGAQDAQGEAFSAATFLTNWNKMTPQARASMFPDKATRDNLADLALIAEKTKRGQAMANTSNTGIAVNAANVIGGGAVAMANPAAALLGAGSLFATGKLMASPAFARILASTAKMPPQAANRKFTEQLGVLATRQPNLQKDISALLQAVNDNSRLAADEGQAQQ